MRLFSLEVPSPITANRLGYVATAAVSLVVGGVGHHKVYQETVQYDQQLQAANYRYNQASTAEQKDILRITQLEGDQFSEGQIAESEYQAAKDYFQEPELPYYRQDGEIVGRVVPPALTVPEHISQARRKKIFSLGGTFSEAELKAETLLAKQTGHDFDQAGFLKRYVRVDARLDTDTTTAWVDAHQLEKFKKLCAQIDIAQRESLPGYRAALYLHAQQKQVAAKNLAQLKDHKSAWVFWTPY